MRLGSRATVLRPGSRAFRLYGGDGEQELEVSEGAGTSHAAERMLQASVLEVEVTGRLLYGRSTWFGSPMPLMPLM